MNLLSSLISFIFKEMREFTGTRGRFVLLLLAAWLIFAGGYALAQPAGRTVPRTVFFDSDGNEITNNEFVDIRMANFHVPDRTRMQVLADGTVEFRLQKVPQEGMRMPEFIVQTLDGKTISTADLKGKVVVLNFWFIGCPVCLAHKPGLNDLAGRFKGQDDVVFLAMTVDSPAAVKRYLAKKQFDYQQAANVKPTMDLFTFTGYPKNIIVSRSGEIVYWRSTVKAWDKFESVIRTELAKK